MACTATTEEASAALRMSRGTLYKLRKAGHLKAGFTGELAQRERQGGVHTQLAWSHLAAECVDLPRA